MVKSGDTIKINDKVARVISHWGQGRHTAFQLDDGRTILDLDQLVANGQALIVAVAEVETPSRVPRKRIDLSLLDGDSLDS